MTALAGTSRDAWPAGTGDALMTDATSRSVKWSVRASSSASSSLRDDEGRPKALGDHAAAVRRVEDDGRMRRGIRHPHVLVEEGRLVRPSLRSHFAGLARSRALHS